MGESRRQASDPGRTTSVPSLGLSGFLRGFAPARAAGFRPLFLQLVWCGGLYRRGACVRPIGHSDRLSPVVMSQELSLSEVVRADAGDVRDVHGAGDPSAMGRLASPPSLSFGRAGGSAFPAGHLVMGSRELAASRKPQPVANLLAVREICPRHSGGSLLPLDREVAISSGGVLSGAQPAADGRRGGGGDRVVWLECRCGSVDRQLRRLGDRLPHGLGLAHHLERELAQPHFRVSQLRDRR